MSAPESLDRLARVIEEHESSRLSILREAAPLNPPAGLPCAVCGDAVDLTATLWGGNSVAHQGPCSLQMALREAMADDEFDLMHWVNE